MLLIPQDGMNTIIRQSKHSRGTVVPGLSHHHPEHALEAAKPQATILASQSSFSTSQP